MQNEIPSALASVLGSEFPEFDIHYESLSLSENGKIPSGWDACSCKLPKPLSKEELDRMRGLLVSHKVDVLQISHFLSKTRISLFCFDMDSTLIKQEVIDELARFAGVYSEVAHVTQEAMQGNLDFKDALKKRCAYLKGLPSSSFAELYPKLELQPGVKNLIEGLKARKSKLGVFSGGFTDILERFQKDHGIDEVRANFLDRIDGKLTGTVSGAIVDKFLKKDSLIELAEKYEIEKENIVAVGDGANDLLMLEEAGIGIGFHAKDGLKSKILNYVDFAPMDILLYLFES
ncbi:phosphoserine phosphatase SerB [Leptospira perolatii]|uniref:Phosphoserine phosphatase n=1 Tax=Leptospira perolatii TaxID=2023191 RepID=A0A2M9ZJS9_9LEPT|nr:phosphoserine phosphatase SerB [Leptospira perolatii]PJZ68606.1 phosphoserine phosphatase SerB [Leptospira perolatii]PJZ72315.1 phosphoserine phosphatase SerB [Leptospira perolatii]